MRRLAAMALCLVPVRALADDAAAEAMGEKVVAIMQAHAADLAVCQRKARAATLGAEGELIVQAKIGPAGKPSSVSAEQVNVTTPLLTTCAVAAVKKWDLSSLGKKGDVLMLPLRFGSSKGQYTIAEEDAPLYGGMTVREFLAFMGRLKGLATAGLPAAVDAAVERLGLGPVRGIQIGRLSRGYRQRVAIAQALLGSPDLLILDEPTNGLDPRQIIEMRELIRSLGGERTILVTSHILGEIERVADRVAILLDGRLLGVHALRAPSEGQRLRLHVRGHEAGVRACLARVPGVTAVGVEGTSATSVATYVVDAEQAVAETLAAALIAGGFGLLAMEPAPVDLETLFLRLTGDREAATR